MERDLQQRRSSDDAQQRQYQQSQQDYQNAQDLTAVPSC